MSLAAGCFAAPASGDSLGAPDSSEWIPAPPDELESTDRLEEREAAFGLGARLESRGGRVEVRRVWARASPLSIADAEVAWLAPPAGWGTIRLRTPSRSLEAAAGAIVTRRPPVLLGEMLGLIRALRAPQEPRTLRPTLELPGGPTSLAVRGAAFAGSTARFSAWGVAGRAENQVGVAALGVAARAGSTGFALAAGVRGTDPREGGSRARRSASVGGRVGTDSQLSAEVLLSPERGPVVLAQARRGAEAFEVSARWRRRAGESRPVAGEVAIASGPRALRTRLSWRPWSGRAIEDDGRAELEAVLRLAGRGPARVRMGARGGDGADRYVIADAVLARERGRTFSLLMSRRDSRRMRGRVTGSMLGGRLELSSRGRAGASLLLQASRAEADVPAWTTALAPSGEDALASSSRSGVSVTGRAWFRSGSFRVEALVSDTEGSPGGRPARGSLRLEWLGAGR